MLEESDEIDQSPARDLEESLQRAQEYETKTGELEEELSKMAAQVTDLEWS